MDTHFLNFVFVTSLNLNLDSHFQVKILLDFFSFFKLNSKFFNNYRELPYQPIQSGWIKLGVFSSNFTFHGCSFDALDELQCRKEKQIEDIRASSSIQWLDATILKWSIYM